MGMINSLLSIVADKVGLDIQGDQPEQAYRDYLAKGEKYSVEAEISEALADLMLMLSSVPISGDSERARFLDSVSDSFIRTKAKPAIAEAFMTGDCIVVPSWNGRGIQNVVVPSGDFEILACAGDEITACAYVVDTKEQDGKTYRLLQAIELVSYTANDGSKAYANRYRMFVARNSSLTEIPFSQFPDWKDLYDKEWYIPNVKKLLIGRYKSFTLDSANPNRVKGVPICYGASDPIREIHYLLEQMHNEFDLSEKMIMADKRLFKKEQINGVMTPVLPSGKERLFMATGGGSSEPGVSDWSPEIRYQAYLDALDKQEKLVERAVGVSAGIISSGNDVNYQNVDNVRKSQQKTMGFVNTARKVAESFILDLVYVWNVLADYYGITPMGQYDVNFDWSDEYIETFGDRQQAILAGESIGATDAVDYRMFVMDESPETARERVAEIKAQKSTEPVKIEEAV